MKKRKKRDPAKTLDRKELKAWADDIKKRAGFKCEWCNATKYLNAHHIVDRRFLPLRYDRNNSMCLCPNHHKFLRGFSAHANPIRVILWLEAHRPEALKILIAIVKEALNEENL